MPNPLFARLPGSKYLLGFTSRPLVHINRGGEIVSDVLEEIPKDQLNTFSKTTQRAAVTLKLKDKIYWADGSKLSSNDIVYSLNRAKLAIDSIPSGHIYRKIKEISISSTDPREMQMTFAAYEPDLIRQLANFRIIRKPTTTKDFSKGKEYFDPLDPGNYNGPYYVSAFNRGKSLSLKRNKHFKNSASNIERIEISLHFHEGVIENHLVQKNVDLIPYPGFNPAFANKLNDSKTINQHFNLIHSKSDKSVQMILSSQFNNLSKQKVRQALKISLPQFSTQSARITPVVDSNTNPDLDIPFKLFQDAGWSLKNKILKNKKGKTFKINLAITHSPREIRELAEHIRLSWEQIGIEVNVKFLERKDFLTKTLSTNNKLTTVPLFVLQEGPKHERTKLRKLLAGNFNYNELNYISSEKNKQKSLIKDFMIKSVSSSNYLGNNVLDQLMADSTDQETVFLKLFYLPKVSLVSQRLNGLVLQNSSFPESYHSTFWILSD